MSKRRLLNVPNSQKKIDSYVVHHYFSYSFLPIILIVIVDLGSKHKSGKNHFNSESDSKKGFTKKSFREK